MPTDHESAGVTRSRLWREAWGPLLTFCVAAGIELLAHSTFKIPNPPAILVLLVVFSAFRGGLQSGLLSAAIAWGYFAYYFSIPAQPFHYTAENLRRVAVWLPTTPAIAVLVGSQRRHIERLTEHRYQTIVDDSVRHYAERLKILHGIDQAILGAVSREAIADAALQGIAKLVPFRRATLVRFDFAAHDLTVLAAYSSTGRPWVKPGMRLPLAELGLIQDQIDSLRMGKVHRLDLRTLSATSPAIHSIIADGIYHYRVVPLITQTELIGFLSLGHEAPDALSAADLEIAGEVADQIAIAIQDAELRQRVERHAADLEQTVANQTEEIRKSRDALEILVSMSPSLIFEANLRTGRVSYSSPNIERIVGYSRGELETMAFWQEHVVEEDRGHFQRTLQEAIGRQATQIEQTYRFHHKNGKALWLQSVVRIAYDSAGKPSAIFGYTRDISDEKGISDNLTAARLDADRANKAKSEFLSRMSHELRTPLNAILGFAQLLEMDATTDEQRESVGHILKGGQHLLSLINEVLDIARIEAGRLRISREPVLVSDVLQESLSLITPLANDNGIRVQIDGDGKAGSVLADRQRLKQVLLNLLSNAVKYNHPGGTVTLFCEPRDGGRVRIKVADTGPGIHPERIGKLFIPFERLGAEVSSIEGTGLGLALSKGLMEAMRGEIGVDSLPGHGSTFWVELAGAESSADQLQQLDVDGLEASDHVSVRNNTRTIVYIEDNASNVKLVQRVLALRPDAHLITVSDARTGLDLVRKHHPDLVFLDLHLPDMPGEEVLQRLQADPKTRQIPIVIVTADALPSHVRRLRAEGARECLTKPLDVKRFLEVVDSLLAEPVER